MTHVICYRSKLAIWSNAKWLFGWDLHLGLSPSVPMHLGLIWRALCTPHHFKGALFLYWSSRWSPGSGYHFMVNETARKCQHAWYCCLHGRWKEVCDVWRTAHYDTLPHPVLHFDAGNRWLCYSILHSFRITQALITCQNPVTCSCVFTHDSDRIKDTRGKTLQDD
jgi:hypothetical protein